MHLLSVLVCFVLGAQACTSVYREYDGTCNNVIDTSAGSSRHVYIRGPEGVEYNVTDRPAPRVVTNAIQRNDPNDTECYGSNLLLHVFGQFSINHDVTDNAFTPDNDNPSLLPIVLDVPENNDEFCFKWANPPPAIPPNFTLINVCPINGSQPRLAIKDSERDNITQEIINNATAWLDLSQVYAPNSQWNSLIRTHANGLLTTTDYINVSVNPSRLWRMAYPTFNFTLLSGPPSFDVTHAPAPVANLLQNITFRVFTSGDVRVGENVALSFLHLLFIREHNRLARALKVNHPTWDDVKLFEEARRRNIAQYQHIVFNEYLPATLGSLWHDVPYLGYDPSPGVGIHAVYASVALRYAHSGVRSFAPLTSEFKPTLFQQIIPPGVLLPNAGQTGGPIMPFDTVAACGGYENMLRGMVYAISQPIDQMIDNVLRSIRFGTVAGGVDIVAFDYVRARLNGVPNYHAVRKAYWPYDYGASVYGAIPECPASLEGSTINDTVECFAFIMGGPTKSNYTLARELLRLYGKVERLDPLLGMLIEEHPKNAPVGPTVGVILEQEALMLRAADMFWFENPLQPLPFTPQQLLNIKEVTLSKLIKRNFGDWDLPNKLFFAPEKCISCGD